MELNENYKPKLKYCGKDVRINELTKIVFPENIEIGDGTRLWDFVFLLGSQGIKIGKRCDIQTGASIQGGGPAELGDDICIGPKTTVLTGEYRDQDDEGNPQAMTDFMLPHKAIYKCTRIDSHAYIGCNVSIRVGVHIGEGAEIGMGAVVNRDIPPWEVWVGNPARFLRKRKIFTNSPPSR